MADPWRGRDWHGFEERSRRRPPPYYERPQSQAEWDVRPGYAAERDYEGSAFGRRGGYAAGEGWSGAGERRGAYGKGPRGYVRSDERILEDVNERLTADWEIDATEIEVTASRGEVTLNGIVRSRDDRRRAEDLAEGVSGVTHVQNNLRVEPLPEGTGLPETEATTTTGAPMTIAPRRR